MKQKSRFPEKFNKIEKSPARQIDKKINNLLIVGIKQGISLQIIQN